MPATGVIKSIRKVRGGYRVSVNFGQAGRGSALTFYSRDKRISSPLAKGSNAIRKITLDVGSSGGVKILGVEYTPKLKSYKGKSR